MIIHGVRGRVDVPAVAAAQRRLDGGPASQTLARHSASASHRLMFAGGPHGPSGGYDMFPLSSGHFHWPLDRRTRMTYRPCGRWTLASRTEWPPTLSPYRGIFIIFLLAQDRLCPHFITNIGSYSHFTFSSQRIEKLWFFKMNEIKSHKLFENDAIMFFRYNYYDQANYWC